MSGAWQAAEAIARKRDGGSLTAEDLRGFVRGVADGHISDAQIAALLMAVYLNGMDAAEQGALTGEMRDSGTVLRWPDLDGPVVDKHSTGGVGDLVSLPLGPMLAACGAYVPMIAGHGLAHTGGTLDKLSAIPGFDIGLELPELQRVVREVGVAIVGQTDDLAPADRRLYAVRDVTGTVDSLPLIVASILSKKLSEGLDALVMDIKVGNGAFMREVGRGKALGREMVAVAAHNGLDCHVLLTDMNQPLAPAAGNALEVRATLDYLDGTRRPERLHEVVLLLGAELLVMTELAADGHDARARLQSALDDGRALEVFARMVAAQGGPRDFVEHADRHLPAAPILLEVPAPNTGRISAMDTTALGWAAQRLGAGRSDHGARVDLRVGLEFACTLGQTVEAGEPLARVHAADEASAHRARDAVLAAMRVDEASAPDHPLLHGRITPRDIDRSSAT